MTKLIVFTAASSVIGIGIVDNCWMDCHEICYRGHSRDPLRIKCNNFGEHLTFHLAASLSLQILFFFCLIICFHHVHIHVCPVGDACVRI